MADEVKKIITVEVGKSITSVRDFRKHIEDLRGALLGLNENSEEYKTIAEQIATDQAKLNEVMKVGKGNTDAAAGSYNELNNQLKALRQQYKALSETERNSSTGQAILQNITKLDTQLKDIDESMGQYYRNVGNYQGAFEEAFKAISKNIGNINPELGKLMRTASSLIPLIKKATTAATTGLKGVKAAMASTGIGLLVVALGEIVAHWEEISKWASKVLGIQKDITAETKKSAREVKDYSQELNKSLSETERLLSAAGASRDQIFNFEMETARLSSLLVTGNLNDAYKTLEELRTSINNFTSAKSSNNITKMEDEVIQLSKLIDGLASSAIRWNVEVEDVRKNLSDRIVGRLSRNTYATYADELNKQLSSAIDQLSTRRKELNDETQGIINAYKEFSISEITGEKKAAENIGKTEEEIRTNQYNEDLKAAEQRLESGIINEKDYYELIKNLEIVYQNDIKEIRKKQWESSDANRNLEKAKEDAKNIYDSLKDYGKNELQILDENYQDQLALLERFGYDTSLLTKKYLEDRQAIIDRDTQEELEKLKAAEEEALRIRREGLQKALDLQNNTEFLDTSSAETMWTINTKTHETDENLEYQKQDRLYQIAEQGYRDRIELYKEYLSTLDEASDEHLDISRELHEEEMGLAKLQYDYQVELEDRLLEKKRKDLQILQGMFQTYGELGATVAGIIADASEEGTARWKAARITETVINTISGAAGAFMQGMSSYPQPWGAIIGAAGAATATATGAAEISKIKATQIGASSVSGISANTSGVGVSPLLNPDYDLQRITNLSLQSDEFLPGKTQVYVLESDIQEVGNRVQVRENNATF